MANLIQSDIVADVRRGLDEITMSGEIPLVDADMEDLASSNFEDDDLQRRIDRSARYVAARIRGRFLRDLMETINPDDLSNYQTLRILGSRTRVGSVIAQRRSFAGDIKVQASGRAASDAFPSWTYEDHELQVRGNTLNPATATVSLIRLPVDVTELDNRFREAVIERTLFSCFTTLKNYGLANAAQGRVIEALKSYRLPMINLDAPRQQE